MPDSRPIEVTRLASALGAEVRGIDLATVDAASAREIEGLLIEHHVLFFPDQNLSVEEHVAFGAHYGELEGHPHYANPTTDHPKIFELAASQGGIADEWHTDLTFRPKPALYSILRMVRSPEVGGDTLWANLHLAFEELSAPLRELFEGLSAIHNAAPHGKPEVMTIHPMVRIHPETGRKVLYVNEHFTRRIVELSQRESDMILDYLRQWVASPRFSVRYRWRTNTVAMWDNRCTQHFVLNDFREERVIQRVTVMGDEPRGASPRWEPYRRPGNPSDTSRYDRLLRKALRGEDAKN
jgi:taurine dioxygenase